MMDTTPHPMDKNHTGWTKITHGEEEPQVLESDPKKALVDRRFAGMARIFFLTASQQCELNIIERSIYSALVGKTRSDQAVTTNELTRKLLLDRGTVKKAVNALVGHSLASLADDGLRALEPTGERAEWFVARTTKAKMWWDRLAYYPVYLSESREFLTPRTAVLLFLLYSLGKGSSQVKDQTYQGLGKMLGCHAKTAKRGLERLVKLKLVEVFRPKGPSEWFAVGLTEPSEELLSRFQPVDPGSRPAEYVGLDEFTRQENDALEAAVSARAAAVEVPKAKPKQEAPSQELAPSSKAPDRFYHEVQWMDRCGIPKDIINNVLALLRGPLSDLPFNVFVQGLTDANKDHVKNQRSGRHTKVKHCGFLFVHNLKTRAERNGFPGEWELKELEREEKERVLLARLEKQRQKEAELERNADYGNALTAPFNRRLFDERLWHGGQFIAWSNQFSEEHCRRALQLLPHLPEPALRNQRMMPKPFEALLRRVAAGEVIGDAEKQGLLATKEDAASQVPKDRIAVVATDHIESKEECFLHPDTDDFSWMDVLANEIRSLKENAPQESGQLSTTGSALCMTDEIEVQHAISA